MGVIGHDRLTAVQVFVVDLEVSVSFNVSSIFDLTCGSSIEKFLFSFFWNQARGWRTPGV